MYMSLTGDSRFKESKKKQHNYPKKIEIFVSRFKLFFNLLTIMLYIIQKVFSLHTLIDSHGVVIYFEM